MRKPAFFTIFIFLLSFNILGYQHDPFAYSEDEPKYRDVKKMEHVFIGGGLLHTFDHADRDLGVDKSLIGLNINLGFIFDLDNFVSLLFDFSYLYNGTSNDSFYLSFMDLMVGVSFSIEPKFKLGFLGGTTRVSYNSSISVSEWEPSVGWMIQYDVMKKLSVRFHHIFIFEDTERDYYYSTLYFSAGMCF